MKHGNKKKMTYGGKMKKMGQGGSYKKMDMGGSYGKFGIEVTASGKGAGSGMRPNFSGSCGSKRR